MSRGTPDSRRHGPQADLLIVEAHAGLRNALRSWVSALFPACRIRTVHSGERAVAVARTRRPRAILMDASLPGLNSIDATRLIRAAAPETRVVVFSFWSTDAHRRSALDVGASAFLSEDAAQSQLPAVLAELLGSKDPMTDE